MITTSTVQTQSAAAEKTRAAIVAALVGAALFFVAGFAPATQIHNAAHDTRHSLGYICH